VLVAALGAGYLFWLRDSSLVAVDDVEVVGVSSGDRQAIAAELTRVAEGMTTLHVDREAIEKAAAAFPVVESVSVDANFPHGMRIQVTERPPKLLVRAGGREVPVAADGTLLTGVEVPDGLPALEIDKLPPGDALGGAPLEQALIVGAAPAPLLPLIERIDHSDEFGVELTLRGDLPARFGTGARAAAKWAALAAVLADPDLDVATYVDVRVPERPAVGGAAEALPAA
jgi:cell division protein FtsQ